MKPLKNMSDDEQVQFCLVALKIIANTRVMKDTAPELRLAAIALWVANRERPIANMVAHFEIDPSSFLDETVRGGTLFFENLQEMLKNPPPNLPPADVEEMRHRNVMHIGTLRDPRYRPYIVALFEDMVQDLKEAGEL